MQFLPSDIFCVESEVKPNESNIFKDEYEYIKSSVQKRKNEFSTGRVLVKKCLRKLNVFDFPVVRTKEGAPVFPGHISGCISHTTNYCIVALARKSIYSSIGLDVEEISGMNRKIAEKICTDSELRQLADKSENLYIKYATLLFSAKECFYKLQYPITKIMLGFRDVEIEIIDNKSFVARLIKKDNNNSGILKGSKGCYFYKNGLVFTGMFLSKMNRI